MNNVRVIASGYGGPEVLQVIEEDAPLPNKGEVRIRLKTAGVALADSMRREGVYPGSPEPPFTPGYDVAGVIDAVGAGVSEERIGEKVVALMNGVGAYTRLICLPEEEPVGLPEGVDWGEAVALALNYVTAYQMLHRLAQIKRGDRILIHGAAGGTGTALLELGRLAGAHMYATASAAKHAIVESFGAVAIDYRSEDFVERVRSFVPDGVDAVFDPIGGANWQRSFQSLNKNGVFIGYGFTSILQVDETGDGNTSLIAEWKRLDESKRTPAGNEAHLYSVTTLKGANPLWYQQDLRHLLQLLAEKKLQPIIARRFALHDVRAAHEMLQHSSAVGKIILNCS